MKRTKIKTKEWDSKACICVYIVYDIVSSLLPVLRARLYGFALSWSCLSTCYEISKCTQDNWTTLGIL